MPFTETTWSPSLEREEEGGRGGRGEGKRGEGGGKEIYNVGKGGQGKGGSGKKGGRRGRWNKVEEGELNTNSHNTYMYIHA